MKTLPVLTDIAQIFSIETLRYLAAKEFRKSADYQWGADRVVSLANRDTSIKNQRNGTCSCFSTIAAIENKLGGTINLSERSLWDYYGAFSSEEAYSAAMNNFIMEEIYWPENQPYLDPANKGKGRYKLQQGNYLEKDYARVLSAIDNGNPCIVALSTPKDLYRGYPQVEATSGFLPRSGHAICVSGYKVENGKGYFLVKNSWGIQNGDHGYQYVAFELFDKGGYVIFWEVDAILDRGQQTYQFLNNAPELYEEHSLDIIPGIFAS